MTEPLTIKPDDDFNRELIKNVHPNDWINPSPAPLYNLVVIGAGPAGLVAAAGAAGLGAKVALIERHLMGGDCLNVGCVPSKSLIKSSRIAHEIRNASIYGIKESDSEPDFSEIMKRLRRIRSEIAHHDSAKRFTELGIDVFIGEGSFTGKSTVQVDSRELKFKKALIATGARSAIPSVDGLDNVEYLTNESVFELTELPRELVIYGAGPIGCELAQAFSRLGSRVTMIVRSRLCSKEEKEASELLASLLSSEGIKLITRATLKKAEQSGSTKSLTIEHDNVTSQIDCDALLIAVGRQPNVESLNLEAAGVEYSANSGVSVNDRLQTSNGSIYAAGDVCMRHKFTHTADAAARIVIQNALFKGRKKLSSLIIPKCTYTDPEIASVGISSSDADKSGIAYDIYTVEMKELDRAQTDSETPGFIKVLTAKGSDRILGATIVGAHAGESISEITAAMHGKLGLGALASVIHPYPTQAEIIKRAADSYNRTRLSPAVAKLFKKWFKWNLK